MQLKNRIEVIGLDLVMTSPNKPIVMLQVNQPHPIDNDSLNAQDIVLDLEPNPEEGFDMPLPILKHYRKSLTDDIDKQITKCEATDESKKLVVKTNHLI